MMHKKASGNFDQNKYVQEFNRANYDRVEFTIPKGSKDLLNQIAAAANNISMAQLIITALEKQYGISLKKEK